MSNEYDLAIVGTGPAGMFAALELIERVPNARIVMLEKGPFRPMGDKANVTSGWGGAGAFSDGKLDLSHVVGGTVHEEIGREAFDALIPYVDGKYLAFGGSADSLTDSSRDLDTRERVEALKVRALSAGLDLRPFPIRHLGTDTAYDIVMNIRRHLESRGVEIRTDCEVQRVDFRGGRWKLTLPQTHGDDDRQSLDVIAAARVLLAPGRSGAEWMAKQARHLGLKLLNNGVDIGVRVEVRDETLREITRLLYESKLVYQSKTFRDRLRTFCMCPSGYVAMEDYRGLKTVNGHSLKYKKSLNTNFAILVTQVFTEPFDEPLTYGKYVSGLANLLSRDGVLVQRLGDLRQGRRSKQEKVKEWFVQPTLGPPAAMPGDLSLVIPYRYMVGIMEMLEAMEHLAPGIASDHTLLYGIEVKFYSFKLETGEGFETKLPGLYVAGDGSGYTRGLLQASMQGLLVARHIAGK